MFLFVWVLLFFAFSLFVCFCVYIYLCSRPKRCLNNQLLGFVVVVGFLSSFFPFSSFSYVSFST